MLYAQNTAFYIQFSRFATRKSRVRHGLALCGFLFPPCEYDIITYGAGIQYVKTILAESFFLFRGAGRFGRHTEPILYDIQRGNGFRRRSRGSFHPARPWFTLLTESKFQTQNLKFLTHLWYNINMGRWCTHSLCPIPTLSKGGELLNKWRIQIKNPKLNLRSMSRPTPWISR